MDAKLKKKWIKALRSGRYKQARGTLKRGTAHCCLGVLYRIQRGDFKEISGLQTSYLPTGFEGGLTKDRTTDLAARNDGTYSTLTKGQHREHDFNEIADYIEKYL